MVNINCDMGEGFGIYNIGDDEAVMPFITQANVACGFHASDPNHMQKTVLLAKQHNVKVGAHFSFPDLQGFGRRIMQLSVDEMTNMVIYQIGALKGFLDRAELPLNHLKPHGSLYGVSAVNAGYARAIAEVAKFYQVPLFGLVNTEHQKSCQDVGTEFEAEFFADLEYDDEGKLLIVANHDSVDPEQSANRCLKAVTTGKVTSLNGQEVDVKAQTICVHSDTPNAGKVVQTIHQIFNREGLL